MPQGSDKTDMNSYKMHEVLQALDLKVERRCRSAGFLPASSMADRHGSWERVFSRQSGQVRQAVILDVTQATESPRLTVELSVAVDDGERFVRKTVQRARGVNGIVPANLDHAVSAALSRAASLDVDDVEPRNERSVDGKEVATKKGSHEAVSNPTTYKVSFDRRIEERYR